jgi:beta-glucosidase
MRCPTHFYIWLLAGVLFVTACPGAHQTSAPAGDIVSKMTLQEKIDQLHGIRNSDHLRYVPPLARLKIPALVITNGPAGPGPGDPPTQAPATALPSPISLAATWDTATAHLYGEIVGSESRDLGNGLVEGPDINIARVPQNGRTFEAFGEDPYLVSQIGTAEIEGIQSQNIIADVKHYVANNQEQDRTTINEIIDERTLHEIYLPAFEAAVSQANVAAVMCAYPKVNGTYNCEDEPLMNQVLKGDWGFQGFVTSDFGATHSTIASALAGLDLEMPTGQYWGTALEPAVQAGQVPMLVIDDKLRRRYHAMMELGVFDNPPQPAPIPEEKDGAIARTIAEEGTVLLKNDGNLLPLDAANLHSIAVIGPYAVNASTGGGGSSHVIPLYTVDPVKGIQDRAGSGVTVTFADGSDVTQAVALAQSADVAIVMVGDYETEGSDHPITLDGNQDQLVEAVAAANSRTVVVLKSGSVELMPWVNSVPALLEAWYPGEKDGNAVAAVLFGDVDPSGKLPLTFPQQLADLPASTPEQYPGVNGEVQYSEGVFVGYRHYDQENIAPLFPFGFGLHFTTFAYQNITVSPSSVSSDGKGIVTVDLDVTNTGSRAGAEVAELYLGFPSTAAVPEPPKQLKGFERIELKPGETGHVQMVLDGRTLSYWDSAMHDWAIMPGAYKVMVGASSRDIRLQGQFAVN